MSKKMKWQRVCCVCNGLIEEKAKKVGKCGNDGTVFWVHKNCLEKFKLKYPNYLEKKRSKNK